MYRAILLLCAVPVAAQSVRVYSEFAQITESGEVTAPARPREILSPAIVRNGFTSFQLVVQVKKGTPYWLYVGQNPEDAVKITLYRESGAKFDRVDLPAAGDSTQVFWMDVWTDRDAPVRRIKIEPQLNVGSDWVVYPMEARVMEAVVPDAPAAQSMLEYLCEAPRAARVTDFHLRNEKQDVALASRIPKQDLQARMGPCDASSHGEDPEWYLRIRDYLFRMR
jgi:hypothetical protein